MQGESKSQAQQAAAGSSKQPLACLRSPAREVIKHRLQTRYGACRGWLSEGRCCAVLSTPSLSAEAPSGSS